MNRSRTTDADMDAFNKALRESRELRSTDVPDICVTTDKIKRRIVEQLAREQPAECSTPTEVDRICGVPFESFPTEAEAIKRVLELRGSGKSVALITE